MKLNFDIATGPALLLYLAAFFGFVLLAGHNAAIAGIAIPALSGLTGAFAGVLVRGHMDNRLTLRRGMSA
jgi:hypothetical protein